MSPQLFSYVSSSADLAPCFEDIEKNDIPDLQNATFLSSMFTSFPYAIAELPIYPCCDFLADVEAASRPPPGQVDIEDDLCTSRRQDIQLDYDHFTSRLHDEEKSMTFSGIPTFQTFTGSPKHKFDCFPGDAGILEEPLAADAAAAVKACDLDFSQSLQTAEAQIIGSQQISGAEIPWKYMIGCAGDSQWGVTLKENSFLLAHIPDMIQATAGGQKDLVKLLLAQGSDVNAVDDGGRTPLFIASALGYTDIIEELIQSGADINAQTRNGITPLMVAVRSNCPLTVETLLSYPLNMTVAERQSGYTALMMAVSNHTQEAVIEMLIQKHKPADLDAQDTSGLTALMHATIRERADIASLLLKQGAACDVQDFAGKTALHYAAERGCLKLVMDLLNCNANVNKQDHKGYTPLMYSLENDQVLTSYRILQGPYHIDLLPKSATGHSALSIAAQKRQRHIFAELLRKSIPSDYSTFRKARDLLLRD